MPPTTHCPTAAELSAFNAGDLDATALERVAGHLDACPDCAARLRAAGGRSDPLAAAVRRAAAVEPFAGGPGAAVAERLAERTQPCVPGADAPPAFLRDYRLEEKLGEGGMGAVYRAVHTRLGRPMAVKVLTGRGTGAGAVARFGREMLAVGALRHPHIVQATDAGEHAGVPFLVMELLDGTDLGRLVKQRGPLASADACEAARQAALALRHAHGHGLVHRDVKPSNLFLTADGTVKLLDLGLALWRRDRPPPAPPSPAVTDSAATVADQTLTATNLGMGTPGYMAPEQRADCHAVDARADLYGLGATLWFLLTGHSPPAVPGTLPRVPGGLADLIGRLLAPAPADRPGDAAAVADALARHTAGANLAALIRPGAPAPRPRRRGWWIAAAATAALGAVAAAALWRPANPAPPEHTPPAAPELVRLPLTPDAARESQFHWADHLGRPVEETDAAGLRLVLVPPGSGVAEPPRPFWLGACEVTAGQFAAFVKATGHRADAGRIDSDELLRGSGPHPGPRPAPPGDDHPASRVSWRDADAYCRWLSDRGHGTYRLPRTREWRWACRAGATTPYSFGSDAAELGKYAWFAGNAADGPRPVGRLAANAWGLHDMHGNVREWCGERISHNGKEFRSACGGSFSSGPAPKASGCDSFIGLDEGVCSSGIGFRVLRELEPGSPP